MQDVDVVDVSGGAGSFVDLDDGTLLALARTGNQDAYGALFSRYSFAAHRLARHLGQREDSEDVVSESFAQVLDLVSRGKGPEQAFRAYLFTTIRHEAGRRAKARQRVTPTDDTSQIDQPVEFGGGGLDGFERSVIRSAYESLPVRWRTVLWHLDVEGRKPHELGPLLDMSANSVSALVYRARSGLREAYLQQHIRAEGDADNRTCRDVRAKLSAFVRRTASARDQEKIHTHLERCSACMAIHLDLQEVNRDVGAIVAPAALAASVTGLAVAAGMAGGLTAAAAHLVLVAKGVVAVVAPPAAAAALTTVTIVGASSTHVVDPPRTPLAAQVVRESVPHEQVDRRTSPGAGSSPTAPETPARVRPVTVLPSTRATTEVHAATSEPAAARPDALSPARPAQPALKGSLPADLDVDLGVVRVAAAAAGADGTTTLTVRAEVPVVDALVNGAVETVLEADPSP